MELPYRGGDDDQNLDEDNNHDEMSNNGNAGMVGQNGENDGSGSENRLYNGYQGSLMEPGDNSVPHDSYDRSTGSLTKSWWSLLVLIITHLCKNIM